MLVREMCLGRGLHLAGEVAPFASAASLLLSAAAGRTRSLEPEGPGEPEAGEPAAVRARAA